MRAIKFRAWDEKRNKMFSAEELGADELQLHPNGRGFFNASSISPRMSEYYSHLIPLEFIGRMDKNGKPIFEGDIVKYLENVEEEVIREVYFEKGSFFIGPYTASSFDDNEPEIIGNIYENGDLLK